MSALLLNFGQFVIVIDVTPLPLPSSFSPLASSSGMSTSFSTCIGSGSTSFFIGAPSGRDMSLSPLCDADNACKSVCCDRSSDVICFSPVMSSSCKA